MGQKKQVSNLEFIEKKFRELGCLDNAEYAEIKLELLKRLDDYGDNKWWFSSDIKERAYYQLLENRVFADNFDVFQTGLEELLGRPVNTHEIAFNREALVNQARREWKKLNDKRQGKMVADTTENKKIREAVTGVNTIYKNCCNRVMTINMGK